MMPPGAMQSIYTQLKMVFLPNFILMGAAVMVMRARISVDS